MKDITLKASHIMVQLIASARKKVRAKDIARQLLTIPCNEVLITDQEKRIIGVITEIDPLRAVESGRELANITAEEVMNAKVIMVDTDTSISELIKILIDREVTCLLITDRGKLAGVVSTRDILKSLIESDEPITGFP